MAYKPLTPSFFASIAIEIASSGIMDAGHQSVGGKPLCSKSENWCIIKMWITPKI